MSKHVLQFSHTHTLSRKPDNLLLKCRKENGRSPNTLPWDTPLITEPNQVGDRESIYLFKKKKKDKISDCLCVLLNSHSHHHKTGPSSMQNHNHGDLQSISIWIVNEELVFLEGFFCSSYLTLTPGATPSSAVLCPFWGEKERDIFQNTGVYNCWRKGVFGMQTHV